MRDAIDAHCVVVAGRRTRANRDHRGTFVDDDVLVRENDVPPPLIPLLSAKMRLSENGIRRYRESRPGIVSRGHRLRDRALPTQDGQASRSAPIGYPVRRIVDAMSSYGLPIILLNGGITNIDDAARVVEMTKMPRGHGP